MLKKPTVRMFVAVLLAAGLSGAAAIARAYQPYGYQNAPKLYAQQPRDAGNQAQTQGYWPGYQQAPQYQQYQQYPQYQQHQQYPQYQQPQQSAFEPPQIEASVTDTSPYEQQSLVYRLRITSSGNLKTITPKIPRNASVVMRALGDPVTTRNTSGRGTEFVTDYHYLLMPLAAGMVEIPPAGVSGVRMGGGNADGPAFEAAALEGVVLRVKPPARDEQPWLPLYDLRIDADIQETGTMAAGNPITLQVVTNAVGATGAQLPSIAGQLKSSEFRIYPGKTVTEGRISADGRQLLGRRVETFTLVPQYGGWLQVPALHIDWWNVRYDRPEVAVLPMLPLEIDGPANPNPVRLETGAGADAQAGFGDSVFFWVPLVVAILIAMYGWLSAAFMGHGRLPLIARLTGMLKPLLGELYEPVAAFFARLSPRRHFHRMRTLTGRHLPVSWKLWFCMRALEREDDPAEWGAALQILAAKHLGVRPHAHLRHIGKRIVACHPRANASQVDRLMGELDEAVYGGAPIESFARWKADFKNQIKPSLLRVRFRCQLNPVQRRILPGLNPHWN